MTVSLALLGILMASYSVAPDPENRFSLEVEKTGLMKGKKHVFSFPKYTGKLQFDAAAPANSTVEFTLDGGSMVCEDNWVKESDRKKILEWGLDKMIEVKQHPELRFTSSKVEQVDANHFRVAGMLNMRGVEKPAVLALSTQKKEAGLSVEGMSTVDMQAWGMKPPTAALGAVGTKPEMLVRFHLLFTALK